MPYALSLDKLHAVLTVEAVTSIDPDEKPDFVQELRQPGSLVDLARDRAGLDEDEASYIASIPASLQEGIRAALAQAVDDGKAVHILYSPAYEFSVQMWDYGQAISIHLSGPYPDGFERGTKQS